MRYLILLLLCPAAYADFNIEAGKGNLSSEWTGAVVIVSERWDDWTVGIGWTDQQSVYPGWEADNGLPRVEIDYNLFVHGQRLLRWKKLELGIGIAYFQNTSRVSSVNMLVSTSLSFRFNKHLSLNARHFSNAGSGRPNLGQDALTIGWTF